MLSAYTSVDLVCIFVVVSVTTLASSLYSRLHVTRSGRVMMRDLAVGPCSSQPHVDQFSSLSAGCRKPLRKRDCCWNEGQPAAFVIPSAVSPPVPAGNNNAISLFGDVPGMSAACRA